MKSLNNLGWKEQLHTRPYLTQIPAHSRAQMSLHRDFSSQVLNTSKDRFHRLSGQLAPVFDCTQAKKQTKPKKSNISSKLQIMHVPTSVCLKQPSYQSQEIKAVASF